jgi:hypothetical protein
MPDLAKRVSLIRDPKLRLQAVESLTRAYPHYPNYIKYGQDPESWVTNKLGEFIWSKQREILRSIRDHRRTAIYGCHRIGKDFVIARACRWWIDIHPPGQALVITSAHSHLQVKLALWRELNRVQAKVQSKTNQDQSLGLGLGSSRGRMNQTELYLEMPDGREEVVAFGRKPNDNDGTAFQGYYNRYVMFVMDEACYASKTLLDAANTLVSNSDSRIVIFGNPDDSATEFYRICSPGSGWNVIQIGFKDTPNYTGEDVPDSVKDMLISPLWVEEMKETWGENSVLFTSKVKGEFPEHSESALIPMTWIKRAIRDNLGNNENGIKPSLPVSIGVDLGAGGDRNVIVGMFGNECRIIKRDQVPNTMETLSNVLNVVRSVGASRAAVDYIGIGQGAVDRAEEMAYDQREDQEIRLAASKVHGVKGSWSADDPTTLANLRAGLLWQLRNMFEESRISIPDDKRLINSLANIRYKYVAGRLQIESKSDMKSRGLPSPDELDALCNAIAPARILESYKQAKLDKRPKEKRVARAL